MLYLLLGTDDFSKKEFIAQLAKKHKIPAESLPEDFNLAQLNSLLAPSLFAPAKVFVLYNQIGNLTDEQVSQLKASAQHVVFVEEKLDKRKTQTQKLLKDKEIHSKEFSVPSGIELQKWIVDRAKTLGGSIEPAAAAELIKRIAGEEMPGSFAKEKTGADLYRFDNELKKLLTYTAHKPISKETVENLVADIAESEAWDIVNAFADKDARRAYRLMESFFKTASGSDEKGKVIQLNASLAEQFRSILIVQGFESRRVTDAEILQATGWKSGRLFVVRKLARKFDVIKVKDFCAKLAVLDQQLKTTQTPPRVLIDLITSQIVF